MVHLNGLARVRLKSAMKASMRLEVVFGGEAGAAQEFSRENGEPDLDLVEPRSVLGREVKADPLALVAQESFARCD
jgi:hypothetical protein